MEEGTRAWTGAAIVAAAWLSGCLAYAPGQLVTHAPEGASVLAMECLDVQLVRTRDGSVPSRWPVIVYRIGNRCRSPVAVHLADVTVRGDVGGRLETLMAHDPRRELRARTLDGRGAFEVSIAYEVPAGAEVGRVCLSLGALSAGAPSEPICVDAERSGT